MAGQIQNEILVQIGNVSHATLAGQAKQFTFTCDPRIVSAAMHIQLGNGDYLVGYPALLIVPMVSFVASPLDLCAGELQRLG